MQMLDKVEQSPNLTPEQKEANAKQMGFKSYEEMILFEKQRQRKTGGTVGDGAHKMNSLDALVHNVNKGADALNFIEKIQRALSGGR